MATSVRNIVFAATLALFDESSSSSSDEDDDIQPLLALATYVIFHIVFLDGCRTIRPLIKLRQFNQCDKSKGKLMKGKYYWLNFNLEDQNYL